MSEAVRISILGLAVAMAFGLGSREIAAREVERWLKSLRDDASGRQGK